MDPEQQQIDEFLARMISRLRGARGKPAAVRAAIDAYLEEGDSLEMSPLELRDYFDISSPGLVEKAGYGPTEQTEAGRLFEEASKRRYGG